MQSLNYLFKNIGEILLDKKLLTKEQVIMVLRAQKRDDNCLFGQLSVKLGFINEDDLLQVLSEIYSVKSVKMEFLYIPQNTLNLINVDVAVSSCAVPFYSDDSCVKIAISDPGNIRSIDKIVSCCKNRNVEFFVAKESEILRFLELIKCKYKDVAESDPLFLLNKIIFEAVEAKASDIHFEPTDNFIKVRFRIDGILNEITTINFDAWSRIKSKIKIISKMDITENRKVQNGHARIALAGKTIDLRVATVCGSFGENVTVRIFDLSSGVKDFSKLGFCKKDFLWLKNIMSHPYGIFLIVGPTGSGKTTTLYSLVNEVKSPNINIITLEDPIEYQIDGIRQLELREDGVMSFSDGIKAILRQDPDIMLVGEIRDEETAATAVRASLTGRLVLATLHASTPNDALRRLTDLGLKLSDFIPSLLGIFSQRLLRYKNERTGRFPVTEYISFSDELKKKILKKNDISFCKPTQTFVDSIKNALENDLTNKKEVERVFGNAFI
ncbi:MAG: Flp pilus assembly complex ATPase component TadA [Alphaproteobacteria bacterium]|nr:Flp pilus assembly complex ATPase component TadA [Alphaproteobacteria bacterium]